MIAYTGASEKSIEDAMPHNFREDFYLIKDINANSWNEYIDMLNIFVPGEGYMMYVNTDINPPNIQFSDNYISGISYQLINRNMVGYVGAGEVS